MQHFQLTVIGCGVFGRSIVNGLLSSKSSQNYRLALTHRRLDVIKALKLEYPNAVVTGNNKDPLIWASSEKASTRHIVVIATQPQFTSEVCSEIYQAFTSAGRRDSQQLVVVTVCPGITVTQLESWLPRGTPIIRSMPNTPISVGQGATAMFANDSAPQEVIAEIRSIFMRISPVVAMLPQEELIDVAASVSGSCPAYVFYLLRGLVAAGKNLGLSTEMARQLVAQSCLGAAKLVLERPDASLGELLDNVCVPGGSTEKAVQTLDCFDVGTAVQAAVKASWHANQQMGNGK